MPDKVTVVVTSCGRFELLKQTLCSFFQRNTYKNIDQFLIIDDSGEPFKAKEAIRLIYSELGLKQNIILIPNKRNLGQVTSIDLAYSHVQNNWVFHLEDDWEFYDSAFIEHSMEILEKYDWVFTVWLRAHNDTNGHPFEAVNGLPFFLLKLNYLNTWHGFTWNPGLRRLSDYKKIGRFRDVAPGEHLASFRYMENGYRSVITKKKKAL